MSSSSLVGWRISQPQQEDVDGPHQQDTFSARQIGRGRVVPKGAFGGVNGIYGNADVRLDGVSVGGNSYGRAALQTVSSTSIVLDDGLDAVNGRGNLAAGHGINAAADTWAPQGPRTVTPTGADLQAALANTNLTSIVVRRENPGTAIVDVTFAAPQKTFLFYERGANSDLQVQALNATNQEIGTYTILRANYDATASSHLPTTACSSWRARRSAPSGCKPTRP